METPIEVEIELDEDALFDPPYRSGYRIRSANDATRALAPSEELLEAMRARDEETKQIEVGELRKRLRQR